MTWTDLAKTAGVLIGCVLAGCTTGPLPIVIYDSEQQTVWIQFDPHAGSGHSHPFSLAPEQIATLLNGVRIRGRDVVGGFGLFSEKNSHPAFSLPQTAALAPYLSQALKKASSQDMVTFYLVAYDLNRSPLVTSGGVFVRNDHLYMILANARTSPSGNQYETVYEPDTKDQPLLPIARFKFVAGFSPREAWIATKEALKADGYPDYVDDSKLVVISLSRLFAQGDQPRVTSPTK